MITDCISVPYLHKTNPYEDKEMYELGQKKHSFPRNL